tara:strand:- start:76 stop:567 length:492 start_codon:yes stop_codon:yes gene_type:complete
VDCVLEDPVPDSVSRDLIHLYSTTFIEEAETLRIMLQDSGVEASIANQGGAMYAVGIPTPAAPLRIMISGKDTERAKEILKVHLQNIQKPPGDTPFEKDLEASRGTSRKVWIVVWLILSPAVPLSILIFPLFEQFLFLVFYLAGIGIILWKLGGTRSSKKTDS